MTGDTDDQVAIAKETSEPECICQLKGVDKPWPVWVSNPDPLGCPVHRPLKRYCRIHHSGFYGSCQPCRLDQIAYRLVEKQP